MDLALPANLTDRTAFSLFNTIKYIYMISGEDFYRVNIKDAFRAALFDVSDPSGADRLGIRFAPETAREMDNPEFAHLLELIRYALAVRIPFVRRKLQKGVAPDVRMLKAVYDLLMQKGMSNPDNIIELDFRTSLKLSKSRKEEPYFDASWFRKWLYSYGGELAQINNRNMFLTGCADALFPLYYEAYMEKLAAVFAS